MRDKVTQFKPGDFVLDYEAKGREKAHVWEIISFEGENKLVRTNTYKVKLIYSFPKFIHWKIGEIIPDRWLGGINFPKDKKISEEEMMLYIV